MRIEMKFGTTSNASNAFLTDNLEGRKDTKRGRSKHTDIIAYSGTQIIDNYLK